MSANIPASVHRQLLNISRQKNRPFQELLQYYAMERFLFRLGQTDHVDRFVLKGALMLQIWSPQLARATKDIDLLGKGEDSPGMIETVIKEICGVEFLEDGIIFDPATVKSEKIKEGADYEGLRLYFLGRLGKARISMQIDIGFGDSVFPKPKLADYPTLLKFPAPKISCYPRETVVAEKFQAMVQLGLFNSRMKDFYDLWYICREFEFDGKILAQAITETFARRETPLETSPIALSETFSQDPSKRAQWNGFVRKTRVVSAPPELEEVTKTVANFLIPVIVAITDKKNFASAWFPPGPWK